MRRKLLSRDQAEISIGCDGLATFRRSRYASSAYCSSTISTRSTSSFNSGSMLLTHLSTSSSSRSGILTSPASTKSSASSATSSGSSININTSLASVALKRVHTPKPSISPFLVSLRQLISSKNPPTTQVTQTRSLQVPVNSLSRMVANTSPVVICHISA